MKGHGRPGMSHLRACPSYVLCVVQVDEHYWYQMYLDDLPIWGMIGEVRASQHVTATQSQPLSLSDTWRWGGMLVVQADDAEAGGAKKASAVDTQPASRNLLAVCIWMSSAMIRFEVGLPALPLMPPF